MEEEKKNKFLEFLFKAKGWLLAIPFIGIGIWWLIKILICIFFGLCLI